MAKLLFGFLLATLLSACGTSVPLSNVPVADGSVKSVSGGAPAVGGSGGVVASNSVAQVDVGNRAAEASAPVGANVVYFDYDSYVIKPEFQSVIAAHARLMKSKPTGKLAIEGHTDERGGREYNLALGQRRAEAVSSALAILGVSSNQMEAVSFGKEKPASVGATEDAFAKNRRAELRLQ